MSRIYDALLKAQKEQAAQKKATIPSEPGRPEAEPQPQPQPQALEPRKEAIQTTPLLDTRPKRITRVHVGKFFAKSDSIMAEQFRKLRSIVTTHNQTSSLRSVLVTSCTPGEGKTKVAVNLSASIAKGMDDSVILVDADLRKKSLSSLLGLRNTSGLSDVLAGRADIQETLITTEFKGLKILPAGFNPPNPAELIASMRMRNLVQHLREIYNNSYILIDSTPIVSTSEASILSQMVDGVIVVILADKARRDVVKRELNTINPEKILGVVLNCAEFETSHYYHKHYQST
jgi:protein-tyrosine kinase